MDEHVLEEIKSRFDAMISASEARIDRTNEMVCKLAESIHDMAMESKHSSEMYARAMESYDKHLGILQDRCSHIAKIAEESQKVNLKLTEHVEEQEKTLQLLLSNIGRVNVNVTKND